MNKSSNIQSFKLNQEEFLTLNQIHPDFMIYFSFGTRSYRLSLEQFSLLFPNFPFSQFADSFRPIYLHPFPEFPNIDQEHLVEQFISLCFSKDPLLITKQDSCFWIKFSQASFNNKLRQIAFKAAQTTDQAYEFSSIDLQHFSKQFDERCLDFTFIIGHSTFNCLKSFACCLSKRVYEAVQKNPNLSAFEIPIPDNINENKYLACFQCILFLLKGKELKFNKENASIIFCISQTLQIPKLSEKCLNLLDIDSDDLQHLTLSTLSTINSHSDFFKTLPTSTLSEILYQNQSFFTQEFFELNLDFVQKFPQEFLQMIFFISFVQS
jgi:hypothetical protein